MPAAERLLRCAAFCNRLGRPFVFRNLSRCVCDTAPSLLRLIDLPSRERGVLRACLRATFNVTNAMNSSDTGVKCAKKKAVRKVVRAVSKRYLVLATAVWRPQEGGGSYYGVGITT